MKLLSLMTAIMMSGGSPFLFEAHAQDDPPAPSPVEYHTANQITVAWDDVPLVKPGDQIEYGLYMAPSDDKTLLKAIWTGPATEHTITMTEEGSFLLGIKSIRLVAMDGTHKVVAESVIVWSDDPAVAPEPFGIRYYEPPATGTGLVIKIE